MSATVIREIVARFGIDVDSASVDKADGAMNKLIGLAKGFVAIAAATQFARWVGGVVEVADKLNDAATRIGTTTQALQGLEYAAQLTGTSAETMHQGLKFLVKSMAEAEGGSTTAKKAFKDLGVSIKDGQGHLKKSDALFLEIADKIKDVSDPTKRAALSLGVFGRAGQELAPLLSKGADGIAEMRAEFKALGGEFDKDFVNNSAEAMDNMDRFAAVLKGIAAAIGGAVLPVINKLSAAFLNFWKVHGALIRERIAVHFQQLASVIEKIAQLLEPWINGLIGVMSALEDVDDLLHGPLFGAMLALVALAFAFISPWVLAAAVIALVVEDLYTFATGGQSAIGELIDKLYEFVTSGDTAFHAFVAMFLNMITTLRDGGFDALWTEIGAMLDTAVTYWGEVLMGFVATIKDAFAGLSQFIWDSITGAANGALSKVKGLLGFSTDATASSGGSTSFGSDIASFASAAPAIMSSSAASSVVADNSTKTMQMTINAAPGMDAEEVASSVANKLDEWMQGTTDALYGAVIPAVR